jgi:hypothetical protein
LHPRNAAPAKKPQQGSRGTAFSTGLPPGLAGTCPI